MMTAIITSQAIVKSGLGVLSVDFERKRVRTALLVLKFSVMFIGAYPCLVMLIEDVPSTAFGKTTYHVLFVVPVNFVIPIG
jgi:hypothetical protein